MMFVPRVPTGVLLCMGDTLTLSYMVPCLRHVFKYVSRAIQFSWLVSTVSIKEHATRRGQNANGLTIRPYRGERPFAPTVLAGL